ncbi:MAG TPA: PTPA-CTERM sorting domain-containing protein [Leptolyngbyaceae cyanobacterium M65_K2018_010]|nr:PTPA-CTERM sorting domain-containing protein [Leptolyngbyaceae cyanobacterium M65_K2018_010]
MFPKLTKFCPSRTLATLGLALGGIVVLDIQPVGAATLVEFTGGTGVDVGPMFVGQSVITPEGQVPFNNITFNWFFVPPFQSPAPGPGMPTAFGTLFLLDREYRGNPRDLSPEIPGVLAQALTADQGEYRFDPNLILKPGTEYFFYTNASQFALTGSPVDETPGRFYFTRSESENFIPFSADANFRLSGTPVPTPALLPGLLGMAWAALRKRQAEAEDE